eukprot:CAMPEP_0194385070 /NCGR_PEP_ID=MMETSP0174-20130528/77986_1 /TAXON_ID=216777 /ORGANISM="Proboscia alata, Strain PI-D3" /LENGTH=66 /DNA_ID=CAMNT_0039172843 /DNA_START=42 /DNA_END=239 /DNA_ORIENTATION=-
MVITGEFVHAVPRSVHRVVDVGRIPVDNEDLADIGGFVKHGVIVGFQYLHGTREVHEAGGVFDIVA